MEGGKEGRRGGGQIRHWVIARWISDLVSEGYTDNGAFSNRTSVREFTNPAVDYACPSPSKAGENTVKKMCSNVWHRR